MSSRSAVHDKLSGETTETDGDRSYWLLPRCWNSRRWERIVHLSTHKIKVVLEAQKEDQSLQLLMLRKSHPHSESLMSSNET